MGRLSDDDERLENILRGLGAELDATGPDTAEFVEDLDAAYPEVPVDRATEARHIAAMVEAAQIVASDGPVVRAAVRHSELSGRSGWRPVLGGAFRSIAVRIAAALVAFLTAFSGFAVAGALPDAVQSAVADLAGAVGIELPDPQPVHSNEVEVVDVTREPGVEAPDLHDKGQLSDEHGTDVDNHQNKDAENQRKDPDEQGKDADDQGIDGAEDSHGGSAADQRNDAHDRSKARTSRGMTRTTRVRAETPGLRTKGQDEAEVQDNQDLL
jgi:hypothetical protein